MKDYEGGWDKGFLKDSVDRFERHIKSAFTGDDDEAFSIMVHGLPDSEAHGISGGCLELSGRDLKEHVFDVVVTKIQRLVHDQISHTSSGVKAILLAGGFGQSSYLKQQLDLLVSVQELGIRVQKIDNRQVDIVTAPRFNH